MPNNLTWSNSLHLFSTLTHPCTQITAQTNLILSANDQIQCIYKCVAQLHLFTSQPGGWMNTPKAWLSLGQAQPPKKLYIKNITNWYLFCECSKIPVHSVYSQNIRFNLSIFIKDITQSNLTLTFHEHKDNSKIRLVNALYILACSCVCLRSMKNWATNYCNTFNLQRLIRQRYSSGNIELE